jgi:hypothetical protein
MIKKIALIDDKNARLTNHLHLIMWLGMRGYYLQVPVRSHEIVLMRRNVTFIEAIA